MGKCFEDMASKKVGKAASRRAKQERRRWARDEIMNNVPIVCSTCCTLRAPYTEGTTFGATVIDEAGQITEVESVAPLSRCREGGIVVFVGDHLRLPCNVNSQSAVDAGMQTSPLERMM